MKKDFTISQYPLWAIMFLVIVGVIAAGILTNTTLRSIEKNIPSKLLKELNDLSFVLENLSQVVSAAQTVKEKPSTENLDRLRAKVATAYKDVVNLRESYVFDNLIQASAFHAVVAPALADLQIWLSDGVSGFGPQTETAAAIALQRITEAFKKARSLNRESQIRAQLILEEQRQRLDRFLFSVNLLFILAAVVTSGMVLLLLRQGRLQQRQTRIQTELRNQRDLMSSIFRAAPTGIGVVSKRVLLAANDRICEMTGYTQNELIGQNARMLYATDDDFEYVGTEKYRQISAKGTGTVETRWKRKDGRMIDVLMSSTPINPQDLVAGVTFTALDITQRKQAQKEKEQLQAQLMQSQKMESVGRLAGGVAHDFNNMLGVILGHTELSMMEVQPTAPLYASLEEIQKAAQRSADLTRQLLAFARKQVIAPKVLNLNDTVAGMLNMLKRLIGEDVDLSWLPAEQLWMAKFDPNQVDQILANLVVNARDAIDGVGKVTIETGNVAFDAAYCADHPGTSCGDFVMLAISDDGSGMDHETRKHIFEPFFTTKEVGRGTGLGLATVYGIVKQNDGFIQVYSKPGEGTTFKIYLPRASGRTHGAAFPTGEETTRGKGETVLVVEDEAAILNMGKTMLIRLGYAVLTADTPAKALATVELHDGKIDLLITDLIMPEMNGRELEARIKAVVPGLKSLFMSGYSANVIAHRGILEEGVQFIQKPFSIKDLSVKVRAVLDQ